MGSTLKGTISLLMNKTCILNFLNKFRELFHQGSILYIMFNMYSMYKCMYKYMNVCINVYTYVCTYMCTCVHIIYVMYI